MSPRKKGFYFHLHQTSRLLNLSVFKIFYAHYWKKKTINKNQLRIHGNEKDNEIQASQENEIYLTYLSPHILLINVEHQHKSIKNIQILKLRKLTTQHYY